MQTDGFLTGRCELCDNRIEFAPDGLGLMADCPHCGGQTALMEELGSTLAASEGLTADQLQAAFAGPTRKPRVSVFYQIALLLVAAMMVVLPVSYLALIAAMGYGVYWYAVTAQGMFSSWVGGIWVLLAKLLLYLGPLLGGAVAVFFMFKPLLARRLRRPQALTMDASANPLLYQFVAQICDRVGAPMPREIDLSCDLNASAGFWRGWRGLLGNNLVLTIGLPLAGGFSTRQLAAVVAHEFGHFNQGVAMRLSFFIRSINEWFARVAYERDAWDAALEEWTNTTEDGRMLFVVVCVNVSVWLSRTMLKLLMFIGHAVSCLLMRQMEFNADLAAIAVAGSEGNESAFLRLRELAVLQGLAYRGVGQFWEKRHVLPDSLPAFFAHLESKLPPAFRDEARNTLLNERARWFDSHPTPNQRIQQARRLSQPGVFHLEVPASSLFGDFQLVSRLVTHAYYRDELGLPVTPQMLRPVGEFFEAQTASGS